MVIGERSRSRGPPRSTPGRAPWPGPRRAWTARRRCRRCRSRVGPARWRRDPCRSRRRGPGRAVHPGGCVTRSASPWRYSPSASNRANRASYSSPRRGTMRTVLARWGLTTADPCRYAGPKAPSGRPARPRRRGTLHAHRLGSRVERDDGRDRGQGPGPGVDRVSSHCGRRRSSDGTRSRSWPSSAARCRVSSLGTAVIPVHPRHPMMLAEQALTVQDASGGRLVLGHRSVAPGRGGRGLGLLLRQARPVHAGVPVGPRPLAPW